jgi:hypothetical protein
MDDYMKAFKPLMLACKALLLRDTVPVGIRMGCQSIFVRITNTPSTA